jgi:hypothetical protein
MAWPSGSPDWFGFDALPFKHLISDWNNGKSLRPLAFARAGVL